MEYSGLVYSMKMTNEKPLVINKANQIVLQKCPQYEM